MTNIQLANKHKNLIQAFKKYQKRYFDVGKKSNIKKFFPEILFRTMRLEGETISRKNAKALFR